MKIKKVLSGLFVLILVGGVIGVGALGYRHRDEIKDWLNGSSEATSITSEDNSENPSYDATVNFRTVYTLDLSDLSDVNFTETEKTQYGTNYYEYTGIKDETFNIIIASTVQLTDFSNITVGFTRENKAPSLDKIGVTFLADNVPEIPTSNNLLYAYNDNPLIFNGAHSILAPSFDETTGLFSVNSRVAGSNYFYFGNPYPSTEEGFVIQIMEALVV